MRILQLHNHHLEKGGAMEVLAHEAELLTAAGHAVEQYTLPATAELGLSPVKAGMKAIWNVEACAGVARSIDSFHPDVVHVHTPFPLMSPAVFRTAARRGVPTVGTVHSFRYSCIAATCHRDGHVCEDCVGRRLKLAGLRHRCYHDSLGASAALTLSLVVHRGIGTLDHSVGRFLTLTSFAKRLMVRDGIPESHIIVKPNSTPDPGEPAGPAEAPYVAFVGRLIEVKGIRTLLDGWAASGLGAVGVTLRIAGDGDLRPLVEERAAADPSIEVLGWVEEAEVTRLMAGARCVVVCSDWYEAGFPLVGLRALSVGTPVLASDLQNISEELLDDGAGAAFAVGVPTALGAALTRMLRDPAALAQMRVAARASYVRRYSPAVNVAQLQAVYSEVMSKPIA